MQGRAVNGNMKAVNGRLIQVQAIQSVRFGAAVNGRACWKFRAKITANRPLLAPIFSPVDSGET
jgi:hypothetical protein